MNITVKFANPAKDGKKYGSIVDTNDVRYACPAALVSRFQKGQSAEVSIEEQNWGGKMVKVIHSVEGGQSPKAPSGNGGGNGEKWWLPFTSNTVAHAIAAGAIKEPTQIKAWAAAAKQAAEEIATGAQRKAANFDDLDDGPQL